MGVDIGLGTLILLSGLRGYFRGFLLQAVRLASLVACVYLADPVCKLIRPQAAKVLATIRPELLTRLLWWGSAVVIYVVLAGLATWMVKLSRKPPEGVGPEPSRGDQGAGFLLGAAKGALVAVFLIAGFRTYAPNAVKEAHWVAEQTQKSKVLAWADRYRPAERIWSAPAVQMFVAHIRRMGLNAAPPATASPAPVALPGLQAKPTEPPPVRTASRPLEIPSPGRLDPRSPDFDLDAAMNLIRQELNSGALEKSR